MVDERDIRKNYTKLVFDLSTARVNYEVDSAGDFIIVQSLSGSATLRLNSSSYDTLDLTLIRNLKSSFSRFFITNAAQAGKELVLLKGDAAAFEAASLESMGGMVFWYDGTTWQKWAGPSGQAPNVTLHNRESYDITVINGVSVDAGATVTHEAVDVGNHSQTTILISTSGDCTAYFQLSDDNISWYDYCGDDATADNYACNGVKKAIRFNACAHYMRIVVKNNAATATTVTVKIEGLV